MSGQCSQGSSCRFRHVSEGCEDGAQFTIDVGQHATTDQPVPPEKKVSGNRKTDRPPAKDKSATPPCPETPGLCYPSSDPIILVADLVKQTASPMNTLQVLNPTHSFHYPDRCTPYHQVTSLGLRTGSPFRRIPMARIVRKTHSQTSPPPRPRPARPIPLPGSAARQNRPAR